MKYISGDILNGILLLECTASSDGNHHFESIGRYIPGGNNFSNWMCKDCLKEVDWDTLLSYYGHETFFG